MQYTRHRSAGYYSSYFPPGVKWLLIINIAVKVIGFFSVLFLESDPFQNLGLVPAQVLRLGYIWQPFTYMFVHGDFWHILINMFSLWMFGVTLEHDWGTRRFLQYYFLCGVGAALCVIALSFPSHETMFRTIGASGAIYGLLLAFGVLYPDTPILFSFLFPIKAKYFVMIIGAIAFMSSFVPGSGVSHIAHLGGMIFGYLFLRVRFKRKGPRRPSPLASVANNYREWKLRRARRKFQVYLQKHNPDSDRWIH